MEKVNPGDVVRLNKPHPCGGYEWEVIRAGLDFRLKCLTCGHLVLLPRSKLARGLRSVRGREI